jgi:aspartyl-tRNA synthetase
MLTSIEDPVIDGFKIHLDGTPDEVRKFVKSFMDSPAAIEFQRNPHGPPGIFICDPSMPLQGLQALGHEGIEKLTQFYTKRDKLEPGVDSAEASDPFRPGHLLILQARPRARFSGGSTALGRLRNQIYHAAVNANLLPKDNSLQFLWVKDFPLFTPNSADPSDPGQGGAAGFSATHHPFTSPKDAYGVDKLATDPLAVIADHYDLVVNGVELGGGSRRVHDARMQRFIMKDVLKMSDERLADFEHLFKVLEVAPPHAGFAIGLDRFVAILTGTESVRDVIAFPKWANGKDPLVGSPSLVTEGQLRPYYLELKEKKKKLKTEEVVDNAVADKNAEDTIEQFKPEEK